MTLNVMTMYDFVKSFLSQMLVLQYARRKWGNGTELFDALKAGYLPKVGK